MTSTQQVYKLHPLHPNAEYGTVRIQQVALAAVTALSLCGRNASRSVISVGNEPLVAPSAKRNENMAGLL